MWPPNHLWNILSDWFLHSKQKSRIPKCAITYLCHYHVLPCVITISSAKTLLLKTLLFTYCSPFLWKELNQYNMTALSLPFNSLYFRIGQMMQVSLKGMGEELVSVPSPFLFRVNVLIYSRGEEISEKWGLNMCVQFPFMLLAGS